MTDGKGDLYLVGNKQPRFFHGYIVALAAVCIMIVIWGTYRTFGVFFKPVLTEFGWTRAMTSGAFSLCIVLNGFLTISMGKLTDRFGPRMVMVTCGFFLGLGYLLMSQISAIWQLYLFYGVVIAIGMGGSFTPLVSTVARWFLKRRGMMTGIVASGMGLGTMIMSPVASRLISDCGWRTSYIIVGIIALVLVISIAQFLRRDPRQMGLSPYGENGVKEDSLNLEAEGFSLQQAVHARQFWMLGAMLFCFMFGIETIMVHIVPHATELAVSATAAANILAVIGGLNIAGMIIIGSASDRIGSRSALIICFILTSIALVWLVVIKEVWMFYLFAAILGFAGGGIPVLMSPIVAELFGLSSHGVILGSAIFVGTIGGAIGPVLTGHIYDIIGSYQIAFLVCAVVSISGIILASLLKPRVSKGGKGDSRRST